MTTTVSHPTTASTWTIDPAHTQVEFEVKHMMFAKVRGRFRNVEATLVLGSDRQSDATRVEAVIESASIDTGQPQRDEHLRSADFFDVTRFPALRFVSRTVRRKADGGFAVTGDLTIRDVTRQVELEVQETGRGTDPWGKERVGFTASSTIDRRDFGLTWNQALETGGILVGTDVRIILEVQAVRAD
jgi:polyisoprenoid-binding protein YceI